MYVHINTHVHICTPQDEVVQLDEVISQGQIFDRSNNLPFQPIKMKIAFQAQKYSI